MPAPFSVAAKPSSRRASPASTIPSRTASKSSAAGGSSFAVDDSRSAVPAYFLRGFPFLFAYCRHNFIPAERAEAAEIPLWLTKRGVLVRARKGS